MTMISDVDGEDEVVKAIRFGDADRVASLLAGGRVDVNEKRRYFVDVGWDDWATPLRLAARFGRAEMASMLLDSGARIDAVSGILGETACHTAAFYGRADVIDLLIARGANLALPAIGRVNRTALDIAIQGCYERVIIALIAAGAPLETLSPATLCRAATVSVPVATSLLAHNICIAPLCAHGGGTALHEFVDRIAGGTINCQPVLSATYVCDMIDMLVNVADVDILARCSIGRTCLCDAAVWGIDMLVRGFIEFGADVDQPDRDGCTPLHMACLTDNPQVLLTLLAAGANVHAESADGCTACHVAVDIHNQSRVATQVTRLCLLLAAGADFDAVENHGNTPRQWAALRSIVEPPEADIHAMRRRIDCVRLDFVRKRALQVCIGLAPLGLAALVTCEVLVHACGPVAPLVPFHQWWAIATAVKHWPGVKKKKVVRIRVRKRKQKPR